MNQSKIVDYWSKFVDSNDTKFIELALSTWNTYFIKCTDKFAQLQSFDIMQKFYGFLYSNKLDKDIAPYKFSNGTEEIEFLAYEFEVDLFLKIKTK